MEKSYTIEVTGGPARLLDDWDGTLKDAIAYAKAEYIGTNLIHNWTGFKDEAETKQFPVEAIQIFVTDEFDGTTDADWSWYV